jgi:RNA polymerase sigma-70 factor (ECF subfamily)
MTHAIDTAQRQPELARGRHFLHAGGHMSDGSDATVTASTTAPAGPRLTPGGFQPLLVAVLPAAYGYALRLTRNRADADDLVQEASLRAFKASSSFEPGTNFKAWYFRILIRCFWAKHRHERRRPTLVEIEDAPVLYLFQRSAESGLGWDGDDPAAGLIDRLGTERVAAAIAMLPEEFEEVCALYFMEDYSYQEIAEVIGCPVGTVRSRLHRGRKLLQKSLWKLAMDAGIIAELARTHENADEQDEPEEMP